MLVGADDRTAVHAQHRQQGGGVGAETGGGAARLNGDDAGADAVAQIHVLDRQGAGGGQRGVALIDPFGVTIGGADGDHRRVVGAGDRHRQRGGAGGAAAVLHGVAEDFGERVADHAQGLDFGVVFGDGIGVAAVGLEGQAAVLARQRLADGSVVFAGRDRDDGLGFGVRRGGGVVGVGVGIVAEHAAGKAGREVEAGRGVEHAARFADRQRIIPGYRRIVDRPHVDGGGGADADVVLHVERGDVGIAHQGLGGRFGGVGVLDRTQGDLEHRAALVAGKGDAVLVVADGGGDAVVLTQQLDIERVDRQLVLGAQRRAGVVGAQGDGDRADVAVQVGDAGVVAGDGDRRAVLGVFDDVVAIGGVGRGFAVEVHRRGPHHGERGGGDLDAALGGGGNQLAIVVELELDAVAEAERAAGDKVLGVQHLGDDEAAVDVADEDALANGDECVFLGGGQQGLVGDRPLAVGDRQGDRAVAGGGVRVTVVVADGLEGALVVGQGAGTGEGEYRGVGQPGVTGAVAGDGDGAHRAAKAAAGGGAQGLVDLPEVVVLGSPPDQGDDRRLEPGAIHVADGGVLVEDRHRIAARGEDAGHGGAVHQRAILVAAGRVERRVGHRIPGDEASLVTGEGVALVIEDLVGAASRVPDTDVAQGAVEVGVRGVVALAEIDILADGVGGQHYGLARDLPAVDVQRRRTVGGVAYRDVGPLPDGQRGRGDYGPIESVVADAVEQLARAAIETKGDVVGAPGARRGGLEDPRRGLMQVHKDPGFDGQGATDGDVGQVDVVVDAVEGQRLRGRDDDRRVIDHRGGELRNAHLGDEAAAVVAQRIVKGVEELTVVVGPADVINVVGRDPAFQRDGAGCADGQGAGLGAGDGDAGVGADGTQAAVGNAEAQGQGRAVRVHQVQGLERQRVGHVFLHRDGAGDAGDGGLVVGAVDGDDEAGGGAEAGAVFDGVVEGFGQRAVGVQGVHLGVALGKRIGVAAVRL